MAEVQCFRWAIGLAIDLGFRSVCSETDCLKLYESWKKKKKRDSSYFGTVLMDCNRLIPNFDVFSVSFVRRTGNCAADYLARNSFNLSNHVWIEEAPPELVPLLNVDVMASVRSL
jgi:hypothetical protein